MNDNDDPVVKEIPVCLTKELIEKLSIFQYPLQPASEGYDKAEFLKVQVKPNNQEVQIDVALDFDSENYDAKAGENIALNTIKPGKGDQEEEGKLYPNNYMDRITLKSSRAVPKCENYAVGVYQDGKLHITPLKSILQIRPQFNHLDFAEKKNKDDSKNPDDDDEDDTPRQVNVSFARNLPDHVKRMRVQSFAHRSQQTAEEFIKSQYHSATSSKAEVTKLQLISKSTEENVNSFNSVNKKQYLNLIAPVKVSSVNKKQHLNSAAPVKVNK